MNNCLYCGLETKNPKFCNHKCEAIALQKQSIIGMKGKKQSEESKRKTRLAHLGKHLSEETKRKIGLANSHPNLKLRGKNNFHWKGGMPKYNCIFCGKIFQTYNKNPQFCSRSCRTTYSNLQNNPMNNIETRRKMSLSQKGRISPQKGKKSPWLTKRNLENNPMKIPEIKEKARLKLIGKIAWNKGLHQWKGKTHPKGFLNHHHKEDSIQKMREKLEGEKCHCWRGGISFEPYSLEFNRRIKMLIKQHDNFTCQLCERQEKLTIHHIDYDKKNSDISNLICLCISCNAKVNFNREKWIKYFKELKNVKNNKEMEKSNQPTQPQSVDDNLWSNRIRNATPENPLLR